MNFKFKIEPNRDKAEISNSDYTIYGTNSNNFTNHLDSNNIYFGNGESYEFDFYSFIREIRIADIPDNFEFSIINLFSYKKEAPLEQLPYPFNSLSFLKTNQKFYCQMSSFTEGSEWDKKWTIEYYFSEFRKVIIKYQNVRIRENENEEYSEGKLKLEILDKGSLTIGEAFEKSLPIIDSLIKEIDNHLEGSEKILEIIETWKKNKENKNEEFWQKLFIDYPEIISQSFSIPFIKFGDKAYLGGKSLENIKGNIVDFAFKNRFTESLTLIEIKTPLSKLTGSKYRNSYSISSELSGAINQLLKYKNSIQKDYYSINYNSEYKFKIFNPKCILIIGSFETLSDDERESFELFRSEFKTIDIVTFDELFDKIYMLLKLI